MPEDTPDLRDTIAEAFEQSSDADDEAPVVEEDVTEPELAADSDDEAVGDEAESATSGDEAEAPAADPADDEEIEEAAEADDEDDGPLEPPTSWAIEDREMFEGQPREAQEFLLRRHRDMESHFHTQMEQIAPLRNTVDQYKDYFAGLNTTPQQAFNYLMNAEVVLRTGTAQQKADMIEQIVRDYEIPLGAAAVQADDMEYVDPQIAALREELGSLKSTLESRQVGEQEAEQAALVAKLEAFRDERDEGGNLLRPYFTDVQDDMAVIAHGYRAAGQEPPALEQLYEEAVWKNAKTRQRMMGQSSQKESADQQQRKRKKVSKARRAGASVGGSDGNGAQGNAPTSRREAIKAALADAG